MVTLKKKSEKILDVFNARFEIGVKHILLQSQNKQEFLNQFV
jgi:hypothetical protein